MIFSAASLFGGAAVQAQYGGYYPDTVYGRIQQYQDMTNSVARDADQFIRQSQAYAAQPQQANGGRDLMTTQGRIGFYSDMVGQLAQDAEEMIRLAKAEELRQQRIEERELADIRRAVASGRVPRANILTAVQMLDREIAKLERCRDQAQNMGNGASGIISAQMFLGQAEAAQKMIMKWTRYRNALTEGL